MFPFGRRRKKKRPFDAKTAASGVAKYIRSRLPGIEITANLPSRRKKQPVPDMPDSDIRYCIEDDEDRTTADGKTAVRDIKFSISRVDESSDKPRQSEKSIYSDTDYRAWEKGHGSGNTFSASVLKKIREKGLSYRQFYVGAGIDRKLFSKIKTDFCYQPTKITAIKCCLSLDLSADEADLLLKTAGYALSETISFDLAVRYCISHGITDIDDVNAVLYELEEKTL